MHRPESADAVQALVRKCAWRGQRIRAVGSAHSSTGILMAEDVLLSLERLRGVMSCDRENNQAVLRAGIKLEEAGRWRHCRDRIPELARDNRNFDFYWYPRSDEVKLRLLNAPGGGSGHEELAGWATLDENFTDPAYQCIPKHTHIWCLPCGYIPVLGSGPELEMVSHEKLCVLNTGEDMAAVELRLRYDDGREFGPYRLSVPPRRVRQVRVNDLIEPCAPPLGREYSLLLNADVPVVLQVSRRDTRQAGAALMGTIGYGED